MHQYGSKLIELPALIKLREITRSHPVVHPRGVVFHRFINAVGHLGWLNFDFQSSRLGINTTELEGQVGHTVETHHY